VLSQSVRLLTQARSDTERAGTTALEVSAVTLNGMNAHVLEVERALLALDHHERAAVIHHGLQSLEDENSIEHDHAEVDAAWRSELRQRIDDIENGKVELLDTDEVFASIRADLAARRK